MTKYKCEECAEECKLEKADHHHRPIECPDAGYPVKWVEVKEEEEIRGS